MPERIDWSQVYASLPDDVRALLSPELPHSRPRGHRRGTAGAQASGRGGQTTAERYGPEYMKLIQQLGGATTRARYGVEHLREVGRLGGRSTAQRHGREHYVRAGKKSAAMRRRSRAEGANSDAECS